jgi:nucleoside-diphosphate-sugar epimerase
MLTLHHAEEPAPGRVVVLGAGGFVGHATVFRLRERGISAIALTSRDIDLTAELAADALKSTLRDGDAVVFVSALTPDRGKDIRTLMRNLSIGEHVCRALSAVRASHVVYISSDAVYDERRELISEATPCDPQSFHGLMHLVRERMLRDQLASMDVPLAILRPSLLYGAEDTHNGYGPNRFFRTALTEGRISLFGAGEERRDHVAVDDVARLIEICVRHRAEGVLNVATGEAHSFGEVADAVRQRCSRAVTIESRPRASAVTHRHFDPTATWRAFPTFKYTPLGMGLDQMGAALGSRA